MSISYECRQKHIKQNPAKPTTPRKCLRKNPEAPGPCHYEAPEILGGKGYCKIKRAPAYTFGYRCPLLVGRPPTKPNAPIFNIRSMVRKGGPRRIINGIIAERLDGGKSTVVGPGPAAYDSVQVEKVSYKKPPVYSMRPAAKPEYQNPDMWTPSANMYWPPIPGKRAPAYSFSINRSKGDAHAAPGPGEYNPKFEYVQKTKQEYSFGHITSLPDKPTPAPNTYCQTKFNYPLKRGSAPSFGIRHSPYLGRENVWLKSSKTDLEGQ